MENTDIGNIYNIVYREASATGNLELTHKRITIDAKSQQDAIEKLREKILEDGISSFRVDKVEQVNQTVKVIQPKKKSILGWIASAIFVSALLAKFVSMMN
ncbi:hypothetical protein N9X06_04150 [Paracoccaceae bacterium]|nr:hypothetical protein [Paracoccaceae bacterium]